MSTNWIEKKWTFNTKGFFLFEKVDKFETGDAKGDPKKKREDTKQFEPGGKWNKQNMCSKKNKRKEKKTHKEDIVKKEKKRRRTNEEKCKEEDKKQEEMSKMILSFKREEEKK